MIDNIESPVNAGAEEVATPYKAERIPYSAGDDNLDIVKPAPKVEQSQEDNAKFAAARREAELETKRLKDEQNEIAKASGWDSWDEMKAYIADQKAVADAEAAEAEKEQFVEKNGIDPDTLDEMINQRLGEHPLMKQAREREAHETEVMAISELNGIAGTDYTDLAELSSMDNYDEFFKYVTQHGLSLAEAYRLTHDMSLVNVNAQKLNTAGKQHIKPSGMSASGGVADTIPPEVLAEFQKSKKHFPGKTIEDFARVYKKLNGGK